MEVVLVIAAFIVLIILPMWALLMMLQRGSEMSQEARTANPGLQALPAPMIVNRVVEGVLEVVAVTQSRNSFATFAVTKAEKLEDGRYLVKEGEVICHLVLSEIESLKKGRTIVLGLHAYTKRWGAQIAKGSSPTIRFDTEEEFDDGIDDEEPQVNGQEAQSGAGGGTQETEEASDSPTPAQPGLRQGI